MANDTRDLRVALARAVAEYKVSDEFIDSAVKRLSVLKHPIRGIDVCTHGICLDFFIEGRDDWYKVLPELVSVEGARLKGVEIFPWGIPWPDLFRVRVVEEFEGMSQVREGMAGFGG